MNKCINCAYYKLIATECYKHKKIVRGNDSCEDYSPKPSNQDKHLFQKITRAVEKSHFKTWKGYNGNNSHNTAQRRIKHQIASLNADLLALGYELKIEKLSTKPIDILK